MITEEERLIRRSQGYDIGFEQNGKKYWINSNTWNKEKEEKLFQETGLKSFRENTGLHNLVFYDPEYFETYGCIGCDSTMFFRGKGTIDHIPQPINMSSGWHVFSNNTALVTLDLNDWDMSSVTDCTSMFAGCTELKKLSINNWNTEEITSISSMFFYCPNLLELDIAAWNTKNMTHYDLAFGRCENLENLHLPKEFAKNAEYFTSVFEGCTKLYEKYDTQSDKEILSKLICENNFTSLSNLQVF